MTVDPGRTTRRRFLASFGAGSAALVCGCAETSDGPLYRDGEVNETAGEPRTAEEIAAAEALATTEVNESATPLDSLSLDVHEFVVQEGYKGPTVRGTVSNAGDATVDSAEVRVRVYGADGAHIGRYLDRTGDLGPGSTWRFEAILLNSVSDIADYDVAVLGVSE